MTPREKADFGLTRRSGPLAQLLRSAGVLLAATLLFCVTRPAAATTQIPYGGAFLEELNATFFETETETETETERRGPVSRQKVAVYREFIQMKLRVLETHFRNSEIIDRQNTDADDIAKKFERADQTIALRHVLHLLSRLADQPDLGEAYAIAAEALQVEFATRAYTDSIGSVAVPHYGWNIISEWRIEDGPRVGSKAREEASNLVDPVTRDFYTPKELQQMIRSGVDISKLDPPSQTAFYRAKDDISKLDMLENYLEGGDPTHEGIVSHFPEYTGATFAFKKSHLTQSKPKLDVYWLDVDCRERSPKKQKKCRKTIKLKFGMETHSDPVANALLASLGYNADISMHIKNFKVYLGDKSFEELKGEWAGYFDHQRLHTFIPIRSVMKQGAAGHGFDERGEWLAFRAAAVELKPKGVKRIGTFPFSWGLASTNREARALFLFNAWIANADMKDEENNKLIMRRQGDGDWRIYLVQQDIGHSLGKILPEYPDSFSWDLVESNWFQKIVGFLGGNIELNYNDLQDTGLRTIATYSDVKWMARLIAQLTREQIAVAVSLGDWPGGIAELYVEKLISRRNQAVQAFGLEGEFSILPIDRKITSDDGTVVDGKLAQGTFEETPKRFDGEWNALLVPIYRYLWDRVQEAIQIGIGAVDVINPGEIEIEGRIAGFPRILFKLARNVELNPSPRGEFDQYIVVDTLNLGLRFAVGYIGNAESSYIKKYKLAFPVPSKSAGINAGWSILDFMLPYHVYSGKLPERYVLFREDALKGGARITTDQVHGVSPVGFDFDLNRVFSRRSVVDTRRGTPVVWLDEPGYWEQNLKLYFSVLALQFPFIKQGMKAGQLHGTAWQIDSDKLDLEDPKGRVIFDRIVRRNDFSNIASIQRGPPIQAESDFHRVGTNWNLFFVNGFSQSSNEQIDVRDDRGELIRQERQISRHQRDAWVFIDNGESQSFRVVGLMGGSVEDGVMTAWQPTVVASFQIDDLNTHSDELDRYVDLLRGLGAGESDISPDFKARDWEISGTAKGIWTRMLTAGSVYLYPEAQARIIDLDEGMFWRRLAVRVGVSEREVLRYRNALLTGYSKRARLLLRGASRRTVNAVRRSILTLRSLKHARRDRAIESLRIRDVVRALFYTGFKNNGTFDPVILSTLLDASDMRDLIKEGGVSVEARIFKAFEDEHNLPKKRDLVGRLGPVPNLPNANYRLFPFDGIDFYNRLNWVKEVDPSPAP